MKRFANLMVEAKELEAKLDTDWAEEHVDVYEAFDAKINEAYINGDLTDDEFNTLATIAFYDYFDLK